MEQKPNLIKDYFSGENEARNNHRAAALAAFIIAMGLVAARLLSTLLFRYDVITNDTALDAVFTSLVQLLFCFLAPFLVYKFILKKSAKQVLKFSSFKKTHWYNYVLAVLIGIAALFVTIGISAFWQMILRAAGYTDPYGGDVYPDKFNPALLLAELVLTALIPAFCEEFAIRGGILTAVRNSSKFYFYILMGLIFGLFHQSVSQFFYTALFGVLAAYICVKTGSIFPGMVIHFFNNATSVYLGYASHYGQKTWFLGSFYSDINYWAQNEAGKLFLLYALVCAVFAGLVVLLVYLNSSSFLNRKRKAIEDNTIAVTEDGRTVVAIVGAFDEQKIKEQGLENEVYKNAPPPSKFRANIMDNVFFISAAIICIFSTIASLLFGFII